MASNRPSGQFSVVVASQRSPLELPADQTRMILSAASAWARAAIVALKLARRSSSVYWEMMPG